MNREHYEKAITNKNYPKLAWFIRTVALILPMNYIDKNDWECNTRPSVYIHGKKNMFKIARYSRCARSDVINAIKFWKIH
jgi:hypothetical protein